MACSAISAISSVASFAKKMFRGVGTEDAYYEKHGNNGKNPQLSQQWQPLIEEVWFFALRNVLLALHGLPLPEPGHRIVAQIPRNYGPDELTLDLGIFELSPRGSMKTQASLAPIDVA